jgi:predicted ATP-grasp superfamily ATP-dependent carboligase
LQATRILVTDAETRASLAVARGLHQDGFEVAAVAAANARPAPCHWSRSVHERLSVPPPLEDPDGFLDGLERAASTGRHALVLPAGDASLLAISSGRRRLGSRVRVELPPHGAVEQSLDKRALVSLAARNGLAPPHTVECDNLKEALCAANEIGYPVVVKPISTIIRTDRARRRIGAKLVREDHALAHVLADCGGSGLVQRRERGAVVSFAGVFADGRLRAVALSRYHRTWRPEAGGASFSQTVTASARLEGSVESLIAELGWEGLFELELIERDDGGYGALDFNPRPYASLALAIAAGVNLPAIWCRHVLGVKPAARRDSQAAPAGQTLPAQGDSQPVRARPDAFYRCEETDLFHALWQAWHGNFAAALRPLRPRRGVAHSRFSLRDPGPVLARVLFLVRRYSAVARAALLKRVHRRTAGDS